MLSGAVKYAARALSYLARHPDEPLLVREVAEATGIPGPYLAKIVNTLARRGFVATQRGVGGGVTLSRDPGATSLYDLCVALDDPIVETRCLLDQAECSDERACPAHEFWKSHREVEIRFLRGTTIHEMAAFDARQERQPDAPAAGQARSPDGRHQR